MPVETRCHGCGKSFVVGRRKFLHCSIKCRSRKLETKCATCGKTMIHKRKDKRTYCSRPCMSEGYKNRMKGAGNPHFSDASKKTCEECGKAYRSYIKTSRFCSIRCRDVAAVPSRGCRKDKNHDKIKRALKRRGAVVVDTSAAGHGFPDLAVGYCGVWYLMEIKNPDNYYGRRLTKRQIKWHAASQGIGGPIVTCRTAEEAMIAVGIEPAF